MRKIVSMTCAAVALSISLSLAGVCPNNGNYSRTDVDIENLVPQANGVSFDRYYNSLNPRSGSLGRGWATELDKRVVVGGDGALLLFTPDRHTPMRYYPTNYSRADLGRVVEQLLEAAAAGKVNIIPAYQETARNRLLSSPAAIDAFYRSLLNEGRISPLQVPVDTEFSYQCTSGGKLYRTPDGFQLEKSTEIELYDHNGHLIAINGTNGEGTALRRNPNGQVEQIRSANGSLVEFEYDQAGRILSAKRDGKEKLTLRYFDDGQLESVRNAAGSKFVYSYNPQGLMQAVFVDDDLSEEIEYHADQTVSVHQEFGDARRHYNYRQMSAESGKSKLKTDVVSEYFWGREEPSVRNSHYLYTFKQDGFGDKWISNRIYHAQGSREETEYLSECRPLWVDNNGSIRKFQYDSGCRLETKETESETITLVYNDTWDKLSRVTRTDKASGKVRWTAFEYTALGNLARAENSRGKSVNLEYDGLGRIATMTDDAEVTLTFEYNHIGKPNRISMQGKGTIDVTYDEAGEIEKVKSDDGHKMALAVTRAFQKLLSLVKPAGVNFN